MSICYVYQDQYPWDIRVEKIVQTLADAKMQVHIVSRNRNGLPVRERICENIYVHRLPKGIGKISRTIVNFPAFFSPFWLAAIILTIIKNKSKLIIVRDLPLGPTAFLAGKLTHVPVLMDMAENYPAMIQDTWRFRGGRPTDYLFRNPFFLKKLEKWLFPRLDGFFVVSRESRERVENILKNNKKPIWIVGNTPLLNWSTKLFSHPLVDQMQKHTGLVLLYTGGLEESRGLETVIRAMPSVIGHGLDLLLVIVGEGSSKSKLKSLSKYLNVENQVLFPGRIDHNFIPSVIFASDICIIPHYVTEHTDTTIPNKIFDYMLQGKPVIATHSRSLGKIIFSYNCGRIYEDTSHEKLSQIIIELNDSNLRRRLGESGSNAVKEHFNWNKDSGILLKAIGSFIRPD